MHLPNQAVTRSRASVQARKEGPQPQMTWIRAGASCYEQTAQESARTGFGQKA